MKKIEVKILNPESIDQAEKMMVCAARLTQRGHQISCLSDFMDLYEKTYQRSTVENLVKLPHPTISEIWNHQCGGRWSIQTIPGTDHQTPERSEVYVSKSAIQ